MKYSCSEHPCSEHHFPKLLAQNFRALNILAQNILAQTILALNIPAQSQNILAQKILAEKVQQQYKFIYQLLQEFCLILNLDFLLRIFNDSVYFFFKFLLMYIAHSYNSPFFSWLGI
jgi:hypothetical protein